MFKHMLPLPSVPDELQRRSISQYASGLEYNMQEGFVDLCEYVPGLLSDIRYATAHNLTGHPLNGYHAPKAIGTLQLGNAMRRAFAKAQELGYGMLVYDAYRPQKAVTDFVLWSAQPEDFKTKQEFYPNIDKAALFPRGYIALRSGHSRGSTIDITLTAANGLPLDMGTAFDFMDDMSHHNAPGITARQLENRSLLCAVMAYAGLCAYECEWWHYRLMDEPYPDTYFDFDIV